jgi:YD repeat-containing protein
MGNIPGGSLGADSVLLDYDGSGNVVYIGMANTGSLTSAPVWQIRHLTYDGSGNVLSILYAGGVKKFNNQWDARVGLTYS